MGLLFVPLVALLFVLARNPTRIVSIPHDATPTTSFSTDLDACHHAHCVEEPDGHTALCTSPSWGCFVPKPGEPSSIPESESGD